jgi:transposase
MFVEVSAVYLHREPVDFRKSIDGLAALVELSMTLPLNSGALFVFRARSRDRLKILYWDHTGFCLWYKRLEQDKFHWPTSGDTVISLSEEQLHWLLRGLDFSALTPHKSIDFTGVFA